MYEQKYSFNSRPFTPLPFVPNYFPSSSVQQTLEQAKICVERASGPVVIVGGQGTGKSLVLQMLRDEFESQFRVVLLDCARMAEREDLFQNILFELGQNYRSMTEGELRLAVMDFLRPSEQCPNGILLLVDEAESLPLSLLDEVRRITNLVRDGQPRVRLVLAGTPKLEENLAEWNLGSFTSRIAARCYLGSLSRTETREYVVAHLSRAGGNPDLFAEDSFREIHSLADGCPRVVNQLCEQILMLGAIQDVHHFDSDFVHSAWDSLQNIPGAPSVAAAKPVSDVVDTFGDSPAESGSQAESEGWEVLEFGELTETSDESVPLADTEKLGSDWNFGSQLPTDEEDSESESTDELIRRATNDVDPYRFVQPQDNSEDDEVGERKSEDEIVSDLSRHETELENTDVEATVTEDELTASWHGVENQESFEGSSEWNRGDESVEDTLPEVESNLETGEISAMDSEELEETITSDRESEEGALETSSVETVSAPAFENPFDETFMSVETVVDRFMPVFVEQNVSSLTVTKSDLELINPNRLDAVSQDESEPTPIISVSSFEDSIASVEEPDLADPSVEEPIESSEWLTANSSVETSDDSELTETPSEPQGDLESSSLDTFGMVENSSSSEEFSSSMETGGAEWEFTGPSDEELASLEQHGIVVETTGMNEAPARQPQPTVRNSAETISQADLQQTLADLDQPASTDNVAEFFANQADLIGNSSGSTPQLIDLEEDEEEDEVFIQPIGGANSGLSSEQSPGPVDQAYIEQRAAEVLATLSDVTETGSGIESPVSKFSVAEENSTESESIVSFESGVVSTSDVDGTPPVPTSESNVTSVSLDFDDDEEEELLITPVDTQSSWESSFESEPTAAAEAVAGNEAIESLGQAFETPSTEPEPVDPGELDWKSQLQNAFTGSPDVSSEGADILSSDAFNADNLTAESFAEQPALKNEPLDPEATELADKLNSVFAGVSDDSPAQSPTESQTSSDFGRDFNSLLSQPSGEALGESPEEQILSQLQTLKQDSPSSIPIEQSLADASESGLPGDDRDMLIVTRNEQKPSAADSKSEEPENHDTPSTGSATRMDYQQLFDQLRNVTEEDNS